MRITVLFCVATMATACGTAGPGEGRRPEGPSVAPPSSEGEVTASDEGGPRYVHAGAPGEDSRALTADEMTSLDVPGHTEADVRFIQGMIPHHAQAIEMVGLMPERTSNPRLLRLGQRIEISQRDEIAMMTRWLRERGEAVDGMHHDLMPGMLTPEQMDQLAAAEGVAFDRLFLELMIGHHEGALVMVRELFSTPGAGQESWTNAFAADVEADQEMEIRRMRQMLEQKP